MTPDGGADAGDALPPGSFDGGFFGTHRLRVVDIEKPTLITGASDSLDVTFQLTLNSASMTPVPNAAATVTVDNGTSLSPLTPLASGSRVTDPSGRFTVRVFSGSATRGLVSVVADALDARVTGFIRTVDVASAAWLPDPTTRTTLAVTSTGMATSSPVFFVIRDPLGNPVEGVEIDFAIAPNSATGCAVTPIRDRSNAMGVVRTTLTSGDSQGTANVLARVVSLPDAASPNFNIVIGRVSEGRMQLSCARTTLGALQSATPPRIDQNSSCTALLADRNGINPPFPLNVSFLSEAGSIQAAVSYAPGMTGVSTTFNTGGSLPVATSPLPGISGPFAAPAEPFSVNNNPRDNFVTIIASVQGEEEFWDGSGSSNGVSNGTWDPGEYWVDLPEPFVDSNDNGTWDPGEPYMDTDRTDCATGLVEPRNMRWDPPNGCWDRATQVWKTTHLVYGAGLVSGAGANPTFLRFNPSLPAFLPNDTTRQIDISWTDPFFNRFSSDNAGITVNLLNGTRGTATIASSAITGESFGHQLEYLAVRAQVSDSGVLIAEEGLCDPTNPDSGYPAVRCLRTYKFRDWRTSPPSVTMTIVAPPPQALLMDGGAPPATTTTWELRATNQLQASPSTYQFTVSFP